MPAFKTKETQEGYLIKLRMFFEFSKIEPDSFVALVRRNHRKAEDLVTSYVLDRKVRVSGATLRNFKMALKLFLSMNDSANYLNWVRIGKIMPPTKKHGSDRAPTAEELRRILDSCDLRMKCVVLLLLSSGMRIGAFEWLKWRDVEPVKSDGYEFAKLTIYRGENEEYYTFVTPECYKYLLDYRALREQAGEKVSGESPLIRDDWGIYKGAVDRTRATAVTSKTLRDQLGRLYNRIGLRTTKDGRRHEFQQVHGFRKFFKSVTEQHVKSIYVELLMGHSTGVTDSYMKPSYQDMVQEYCRAVPALTILTKVGATMEDIDAVKREAKIGALRSFAESIGVDPAKVKVEFMEGLSPEEEERLIKLAIRDVMKPKDDDPQMVIPVEQVEQSLKDGWEFVASLPNGKVIVKK